ncbi:D123-domain-containing protein [Dacryopinax primogenitus]|uniref:D123-domain-containing protein n=1 Tax=Dacryopinax primogenitus (strain DJM 731) TaxID=1858805 RepID=M5FPR2_DACPD|nr:D123-domain-containing protein [Dacryopinax primogenitus]EJT98720.1 D123-domain-containing protein [Dacryopinax primogenitus]
MSPLLFPPITRSQVLACQVSSWYPIFASITIKTIIIRPLSSGFRDYLLADGVYIPTGAEDRTYLSNEESDEDDEGPSYTFPELDAQIRQAIALFGAVFPKLNWSSPKDAAWMLPRSSPLKCTSPADVYLLLKSSDFVNFDLDPVIVFEGCEADQEGKSMNYELELSLRKWYTFDTSREFRCFVRDNVLLGISQRDPNYYNFLNSSEIQVTVRNTIERLWRENLMMKCPVGSHYVFDVLLTRDFRRAHLIDINPFARRTDPLLFTYQELLDLAMGASYPPKIAVVNSQGHAEATRNAPAYQHNMLPFEALHFSAGRTPENFSDALAAEIIASQKEHDGRLL